MKNTLRQVFHSPKFVVGFGIFVFILLIMLIYPMFNPGNPLEMIGVGTFASPGTYVSLYDAVGTDTETLRLSDADDNRIAKALSAEDRVAMVEWFTAMGIDVSGLDINDTDALVDLWNDNYEVTAKPAGMTMAKRNYYKRLNNALLELRSADVRIIADENDEGDLEKVNSISKTDYVNIRAVANVKTLPLGTDNFGRDVLKELVSACGTSIRIGLIAGAVATIIGLTLGLLAGYFGGWVDYVIMRLADIMLSIPSLLLAMVVMYTLGQSTVNLFIALSLTSWASVARVVRSQTLSLKESEYVEAARSIGVSNGKIMLKHILPNCISTILVQLTLDVAYAILDLASLSFLGLGTLPPQADWGAMLDEGRSVLLMSPVQSLSAGIVIVIVVVSLNIFSDGLHQYLDQAQTALPSFRKYEKKFLKKKGGAADGKPA